ncbi:MAG: 2-polyprenylphenol 6-hydroxylase [Alphaproteobacteria bacterium]|nr:MAG: 2-polyprenylphenol 6-hydroxylase [Alphaproteobacteria bacterium]
MLKSLRHMARLIRVAFVLSRHDALIDLLSLFGEQPRALTRLRKLRKSKNNLVEAFQFLGPSFIKIGQAMSTRPDIVGPDVALDLMRLQDKVPPFPGDEAIRIIEQELNRPLNQLFTDFDSNPVAAASIAQVHFATTMDGRSVAVKVLRPGIEKAFSRDLESFLWLARIVERFSAKARRLKPTAVVETISETITLELDLRYEAAAASELKDNSAGNDNYAVPDVDWDLTSRRVLCTSLVEGIPFAKKQEMVKAGYDLRKIAEGLVHSFLTQALGDGFFHADLHQGNLFARPDNKITAIDFGIMGRIDKKTRRCLAEILYGFITQDYDLIAKAHFDIGYVPEDQSLEKFKQAIRAIGAPIAGKPVKDISVGNLLAQLFETTETFNMQTQPQLILLQKTMVTVEGVALDLYPDINMWEASRPIIEKWMLDNLGPQAKIRDFAETTLHMLNRIPKIADDLEVLANAARKIQAAQGQTPRHSALKLFLYGLAGGMAGSLILYYSLN